MKQPHIRAELPHDGGAGQGCQRDQGGDFQQVQAVVYKTTDGGDFWHSVGLGENVGGWGGNLAIDPLVTNTLYVGTAQGLLHSTDVGVSWTCASRVLNEIYPIATTLIADVVQGGIYQQIAIYRSLTEQIYLPLILKTSG